MQLLPQLWTCIFSIHESSLLPFIFFLPHGAAEWLRGWVGVWLLHKQLPSFPCEAVLLTGFPLFLAEPELCASFSSCGWEIPLAGEPYVKSIYMEISSYSPPVPGDPYGPALPFSRKRQESWAIRKLLYRLYTCGYIQSQPIGSLQVIAQEWPSIFWIMRENESLKPNWEQVTTI